MGLAIHDLPLVREFIPAFDDLEVHVAHVVETGRLADAQRSATIAPRQRAMINESDQRAAGANRSYPEQRGPAIGQRVTVAPESLPKSPGHNRPVHRVGLLASLLPPQVAVQELFAEETDEADHRTLFPAERAWIERAVASRRHEFATSRRCARAALAELGQPPVPLVPDAAGAPQWPTGFVGSITHCAGYRGVAVARAAQFVAVGVDAEVDDALPDGVLELVALPEERRALARLPATGISWQRLLFSCKESVYKAWYPLTREWLDFEQARIRLDATGGTFRADLLVPGPVVAGRRIAGFEGRWAAAAGLIGTAVLVAASARDS